MKETLRLHPFVLPFRTCNADTTVQGRPVPAGTMVQAAIGVMHRDPVHFPSPDSFRPHRFIDGLSPEAALRYQPFGMGPRGCLGCAPSRHDPTCMRHMHVQPSFQSRMGLIYVARSFRCFRCLYSYTCPSCRYRLAVFEAVVAVVTLHQRFAFHLSAENHPDGTIAVDMPGLTRPTHGIWMSAVPYTPQPHHHAPAEPAAEQPQQAPHSTHHTVSVPRCLVTRRRAAVRVEQHSMHSGHGG